MKKSQAALVSAIIGFNSYGEQWARFGGPAVHQNLTVAFLVIGKEKAF